MDYNTHSQSFTGYIVPLNVNHKILENIFPSLSSELYVKAIILNHIYIH
jgi:hypothetical protein